MNRARAEAKRPLRDSGRSPQSAQRPAASVMGLGCPFLDPEHERAILLSASGARSYEGSLPVRAETLVSVREANRDRSEGHPDSFDFEREEQEKILYCHECNYVFDSYGAGWRRCPECGSPVCDHLVGQCQCLNNY